MFKKKEIKVNDYQIPEYILCNWEKIDDGYLRFTLEHAEKMLMEMVKSGEHIRDRAFQILTIAITVVTGCLIYLNTEKPLPYLSLAAWLGALLCSISIAMLLKPILSYATSVAGARPEKILLQNCIEPFLEKKNNHLQLKSLILSECAECEKKIRINNKVNNERSRAVDMATIILAFLPVTLIISLLANFFLAFYN